MALSDLAVRKAKGPGKAYTLADVDGLSLAAAPGGGKCWHFRYQGFGKHGTVPAKGCGRSAASQTRAETIPAV